MAESTIAEIEVPPFDMNGCYKKGSVEGPRCWKTTMAMVVARLVPAWYEQGWGLRSTCFVNTKGEIVRGQRLLSHLIWADHLWLLASDQLTVQKMTRSVTELFNHYKLL